MTLEPASDVAGYFRDSASLPVDRRYDKPVGLAGIAPFYAGNLCDARLWALSFSR
jgi:hypothetical protein